MMQSVVFTPVLFVLSHVLHHVRRVTGQIAGFFHLASMVATRALTRKYTNLDRKIAAAGEHWGTACGRTFCVAGVFASICEKHELSGLT